MSASLRENPDRTVRTGFLRGVYTSERDIKREKGKKK